MKTAALSFLALLIAQAAAAPSPRLVVPDAPDLMIKTRRTIDRPGTEVTTEVVYLKGARQRRETQVEHPPQAGPYPGPGGQRTFSWLGITQCDARRMLLVNQEAKTYAYSPITDPAEYRIGAAAGRNASSYEMTTGPTVRITIDTVDTGERRRFGHYVARRVITTRTVEPGPGARTPAGVDTHDGWYLDVPPVNCTEWEGMVTASVGFMGFEMTSDRVEIKHRGAGRRGYPIEETNRRGDPRHAVVTKIELLEVSEAPLDDALFTVPAGYRAALQLPQGGYDLSKPDTLMNRIDSYRQLAGAWADYIRRNGLLGIIPGTTPPGRY